MGGVVLAMDAFPTRRFRTAAWTLGVAVMGAVLLGFGVSRLPVSEVMPALGMALLLLNLLGIVLFLLRARASRSERTGWLLLAVGALLALATNSVSQGMSMRTVRPGVLDWSFLLLHVGAGLVQSAGLLCWPRRRQAWGSPALHLLGSLLFAGSLVLLMWLVGIWSGADAVSTANFLRQFGLAGRVALFGGTVIYLVGVDARQIRGPMGWFLGGMLISGLTLVLMRPFVVSAMMPEHVTPWFGVAILAPVLFGMAAWVGGPVLSDEPDVPLRLPLGEVATYGPYLVSGSVLGYLVLRRQDALAWPLLAFIAITGLLVLRQFLLLRELRQANLGLEVKVADRTRDLERLQSVVVRTERLNALATLGAGLTHDLNNLLTAIHSSAELMQMDVEEGQPPSLQDLARIQEATSKAGSLTRRIMAFARREQELGHRAPMAPAEAVRAMEELLRMLCGSGITLGIDIAPALPDIQVDSGILEQVLVNLVGNGRDALNGKGTISIRLYAGVAENGRPTVVLEVEDSGPGVPVELRARIFDPFFTTKPEGKGTGLGLASVQALAGSLGGWVELVESKRGACFRFTIPS